MKKLCFIFNGVKKMKTHCHPSTTSGLIPAPSTFITQVSSAGGSHVGAPINADEWERVLRNAGQSFTQPAADEESDNGVWESVGSRNPEWVSGREGASSGGGNGDPRGIPITATARVPMITQPSMIVEEDIASASTGLGGHGSRGGSAGLDAPYIHSTKTPPSAVPASQQQGLGGDRSAGARLSVGGGGGGCSGGHEGIPKKHSHPQDLHLHGSSHVELPAVVVDQERRQWVEDLKDVSVTERGVECVCEGPKDLRELEREFKSDQGRVWRSKICPVKPLPYWYLNDPTLCRSLFIRRS